MTSIIYVGMDVHTTNYTMSCYTIAGQEPFGTTQIAPDVKEIEKYLKQISRMVGGDCEFVCGYEAGCLGYSLYHQLTQRGIKCIILAPTTMASSPKERVKTDRRDAIRISKCLAYGTYSAVYIPQDEDDAVKEYIRMRDDGKTALKQVKQQIIAFCTRHGHSYAGKSYWTIAHLKWLRALKMKNSLLQETLAEYMLRYSELAEKVERYEKRIEELANSERYKVQVSKLVCFNGIAVHTALSFISEIGDFSRFPSAQQFSSFLGLTPGEHSSGTSQSRSGITKAGNSHLRKLLIESAQAYSRGAIGYKSAKLKAKQDGADSEIIRYADKANERLKRKYYRLALRTKHNIAKTAVARELSCFIWGMMTGRISAVLI